MLRKFLMAATLSAACLAADDAECSTSWLTVEYLNWKIQDSPVIPLVLSTHRDHNTILPILGEQHVHLSLGGRKVDNRWHSGARFTAGTWFDDLCMGFETSYYFLGQTTARHRVYSEDLGDLTATPPILPMPFQLAVPYVDANTGLESSFPFSVPGQSRSGAKFKISNRLQGAECNLSTEFNIAPRWNIDGLCGFRYLDFSEHLTFNTYSMNSPDFTRDKFGVQNNFYGGQIGLNLIYNHDNFIFDIEGKVALGAICQASHIEGKFLRAPGLEENGGFFTFPSNSGRHKRTQFSVIPEVNLNFSFVISEYTTFKFGYNVFYVTNAVRASKQMRRTINPSQSALYEATPILAEGSLPSGSLRTSTFWVQGMNAGFEFRF